MYFLEKSCNSTKENTLHEELRRHRINIHEAYEDITSLRNSTLSPKLSLKRKH